MNTENLEQSNLSNQDETSAVNESSSGDTFSQEETAIQEEPQSDLASAPASHVNPVADLMNTFGQLAGSMNAQLAHQLGSKISAVASFLEDDYSKNWKERLQFAHEQMLSANKERDMHKENALQQDKRSNFLQERLIEAETTINSLRDEIEKLKNPVPVMAPEAAVTEK
jgi:hypothetical protein